MPLLCEETDFTRGQLPYADLAALALIQRTHSMLQSRHRNPPSASAQDLTNKRGHVSAMDTPSQAQQRKQSLQDDATGKY